MLKVILTKGLPASGKSTWAREQVAANPGAMKRVNKDELRDMLDNGTFSKANETFVLRLRDHVIVSALAAGKHVIVDDTNLHPRHEEHIRQLVREAGLSAEIVVEAFDTDVEECIARDLARPKSVGERVIRRMHRDFVLPAERAASASRRDGPDGDDLPECIIVDLDGTLAIMNGRNPYDASRCEEDAVNEVVRGIASHHERVILCSGREDAYRAHTERWLAKHEIPYTALYMRAAGDKRKDAIVKRELYEAHIEGVYKVLFVLDDRNQVVDLWRSLGLVCLQVAAGDF